MNLNRLTQGKAQDTPRTSLELITRGDRNSLVSQYESFVLNAELYHSPYTARDYKYKLRYFLHFCFKHDIQQPSEVTGDLVKAYLFYLKDTVSSKSQNGYCKVVRAFFNWMVDEDRLKNNPMEKVKTPKSPEKVIRIYSPDHLKKIMLLCQDCTRTSIRNRAMVLVLLDTGMRRKELAGMKLQDVDIKTGDIYIMGKGDHERVVRVSPPTLKALVEYCKIRKGDHPQIWLSEEGRPLTVEGVSMIFKVLKDRAGFTDVRLSAHTFRHTSGTMEMFAGATQRQVELQLGHRTSAMTKHYTALVTSALYLNEHKNFSPVSILGLK